MSSSHYTHGSDGSEQERLTGLNRRLNERCLAPANFRAGERVIDFGAGLGQFSRMIARTTGIPVVAIERSPQQIEEAQRQATAVGETNLLTLREGDVLSPPIRDEEWGTFDVAHARFVLEHVPDPAAVVHHMARAVRPGGRVILADDDYDMMRLWPEPPGFAPLWQAYQRTYDRHGNDPIVGRRLVQLLHQAKLHPHRNTFVFFGGCSGEAEFGDVVRNIASILDEALDDIIATGVPRMAAKATIDALLSWSTEPSSAVWYAMAWAEGLKPA